jgi:hypothetical protein
MRSSASANVELLALSILQERPDARPQNHAGAGNSRILVSADDRPLFALSLLSADAQWSSIEASR